MPGTAHLQMRTKQTSIVIMAEVGTEIRLSLSTPESGVTPSAALIGPGITGQAPLPGFIKVPEGQGSVLITAGNDPEISYEPFTPMAMYEISSFSTSAPAAGDYTVVVFGDEGRYILATGYLEEFSLTEWVSIPVSVLAVRIWQGQSLFSSTSCPYSAPCLSEPGGSGNGSLRHHGPGYGCSPSRVSPTSGAASS